MTSNPITIAGETLTEQDWPRGSPYFDDDDYVFRMPDPECDFPAPIEIDNADSYQFGLIAAVARCHFLDKAAECQKKLHRHLELNTLHAIRLASGMKVGPYPDFEGRSNSAEWETEAKAYLQSAEKWARISKGVK